MGDLFIPTVDTELPPLLLHIGVMHALGVHVRENGKEHEVCGFILGDHGKIPEHLAFVPNVADHPALQYEMSAEHTIEAQQYAEDNGMWIAATFHSHVHGPARPSNRDRIWGVGERQVIIAVEEDMLTIRGYSAWFEDELQVEPVTYDFKCAACQRRMELEYPIKHLTTYVCRGCAS